MLCVGRANQEGPALSRCVCLSVCLPGPQNNNQRRDEVSLTVREEELLSLCPTKSFNTPANMCIHTHRDTHTK